MVFLQDMLRSVIQKTKTSLNTFLSAITCPGKKIWPVSCRNRWDFHNLMPVGFGGAPVHIPELKRETFAKAHEQWYNAANALIVLDGTLDPDAALAILDEALPAGQRQPTPPPPLQVRAHGGTTVVD